jgi:hypothetical protein
MKTIKFLKMTALMAIFMLTANLAYSTSDVLAIAKQDLKESITNVFKEDISKTGNYLYENQVYILNDKAKVTFRVNENRELEIIDIKCKNCDAAEYVKYVISQNEVKADQMLVGKAYTIDIRLKFQAK